MPTKFTTVNPFLSEAHDPEIVYYNGQLMCTDDSKPLAKYVDAQDVPILKDVGDFSVLLTQLEMNNVTKTLPVFQLNYDPSITQNIAFAESTSGANLVIYGDVLYDTNLGDFTPKILDVGWNAEGTFTLEGTQYSLGPVQNVIYADIETPNLDYYSLGHFEAVNQNFTGSVPYTVKANLTQVYTIPGHSDDTDVMYYNSANKTIQCILFTNLLVEGVPTILQGYDSKFSNGSSTVDLNIYDGTYSYNPTLSNNLTYKLEGGYIYIRNDAFPDSSYNGVMVPSYPYTHFIQNPFTGTYNVPIYYYSCDPNGMYFIAANITGTVAPYIPYKFQIIGGATYTIPYVGTAITPTFKHNILSGGTTLGATQYILDGSILTSLFPTPFNSSTGTFTLTNASVYKFGFTFGGLYKYYGTDGSPATGYAIQLLKDPFNHLFSSKKYYYTIADLVNDFQLAFNYMFNAMNGSLLTLWKELGQQKANFFLIQTNVPIISYNTGDQVLELYYDPYGFIATTQLTLATGSALNPANFKIDNQTCFSFEAFLPLVNDALKELFIGFTFTNQSEIDARIKESVNIIVINTNNVVPKISNTTGQQEVWETSTLYPTYRKDPKNTYIDADADIPSSKYPNQQYYVIKQEYSFFGSGWSPVDSIVMTTTNIPVQKEYNTKVLQANETNNLGNNTNKGTFLNILYTLTLPSNNPNDWRALITLPMIPEHKKNYMMTLNTELKVLDVQFWWKNRLTNELVPLTMPKNSSILFKLRFRKEK